MNAWRRSGPWRRAPLSNYQITGVNQRLDEERIADYERSDIPFISAVDATRKPMVVTDPTVSGNPIIYMNEAFIDLFGYTRDEVLGQNYFFLAGTNTDPVIERNIR